MNIQKLIDNMTIEEKVGQMCVPILQKAVIDDDIKKYIEEYGAGMLRYCPNAEYDGNSVAVGEPNTYFTADQTAEFLNSAQVLAKIPMFIAVDQEGSIRNDLNRAGAFAYSGHMSFGAADDVDLTYKVAFETGTEFAAMGINLVQAPIVDVLAYSGRKTMKSASFGEDTDMVCRHALAMMKGFQAAGIAAMAKHFPGYGSVATDAHKGLAEITKDFRSLDDTDIKPLKTLFANGLNGVMTGHVLTHCIDDEYPATMSAKMITGYLRNTLGFDGIVETDAMRMPAIQNRYGTAFACVKAVAAGCDLLLLRGDIHHFEDGYYAVLNAVRNGEISMDLINKSVTRILREKNRIGLLEKPFADPEKAKRLVGCAAHKETAARLAENSVSLLKNTDLPLKPGEKIFVVCVEPQKLAAAEDSEQCVDMLYKAVKKRFSFAEGTVAALSPTDEEIRSITERAKAFDTIVIGTCNAILYEKQAELANSLLGLKKKVIVAAMDSPYDIEVLKNVKNYICTYGVAAASTKVCADILSDGAQKIIVPPVTINL